MGLYIVIGLAYLASTATFILLIVLFKKVSDTSSGRRIEQFLKEEFSLERADTALYARNQREEIGAAVRDSARAATEQMLRINESIIATISTNARMQKEQLEIFATRLDTLTGASEKKLSEMRSTIEIQLKSLQEDNGKKLEQMRATVDEKLQGTLERRLGEAFKQVGERLELVHKGLGEMQTLTNGIGDLKKVFANVKTRGTWGEVQLGALLSDFLAPDQYEQNVQTKRNSRESVEYAIKLPGRKNETDEPVWLPIDAKFPLEDYHALVAAQESGVADHVDAAGKRLETRIKTCAREIRDKYLNPPHTTDFAFMYLATEGLYAEITQRPDLCDFLQRECRVVIAGPSTLVALLSTLQMGFRTLAIEKQASEVWKVLGAVKTQFGLFGQLLQKVHKKLEEATNVVETATKKSQTIERKLRDVETLPLADAELLLTLPTSDTEAP